MFPAGQREEVVLPEDGGPGETDGDVGARALLPDLLRAGQEAVPVLRGAGLHDRVQLRRLGRVARLLRGGPRQDRRVQEEDDGQEQPT